MNETNCSTFKKRAAALAVASCISLMPGVVEAAGIGKLTVLSGLGQPLRAELEIAATRDELAGMTARLAPQEAFRQAGIDYASVLLDLRFTLDKRPNGQPVVKVTSAKPLNEPFLDFLVELNWPAGRLVREYTFLLDPPEIAAKQASRPVADARIVETVQGGGAVPDRPLPAKAAAPRQAPPPKAAPQPAQADTSAGRVVRQGETLRKIAAETKYDGVSLDQMLVGLFQKNPDAFIGNNINRLKAGAILGIPEQAVVDAVTEAEAKKIYVAQAADWNAYRQRLAASTAKAPVKEEAASQSSSGKIAARIDEKATPAEQAKDQVKVSPTELPGKGATAGKTAVNEADQVAKEKAIKEAQERLVLLEKNVNELQKLVEMKNQKLAELEQQAAAKKVEIKPVEPAKPIEPPKPVESPKPEVAVPAPQEPAPVVAEKPVELPKAAVPKPQPPKQPLPPPEPEPEPSFLDSLLSDPLPLAGGGGLLALLAGYFLLKRRRNQNASVETTAAPGPSSLGPNSVFRMTGGQSVDTGNTPPQTGDFSQTGPGTIDTDEVDPVAEADVYMAYGRDTQAEEILLEALQKDPQRTAIHAKLLEIYANRGSLKQFETLASELYAQTGGIGAEWGKVALLGAALDPNNPLYSGSRASAPAFDADATMIVSLEKASSPTLAMSSEMAKLAESTADQEIGAGPADFDLNALVLPESTDAKPAEQMSADVSEEAMTLDFDLGLPAMESAARAEAESVAIEEPSMDAAVELDSSNALDFDLDSAAPLPSSRAEEPVNELSFPEELTVGGIDFDLNIPDEQPLPDESSEPTLDFSPEGTLVMPSPMDDDTVGTHIDFDSLPDTAITAEAPAIEEPPLVDFDLDIQPTEIQPTASSIAENAAIATVVDPDAMRQAMEFDNPKLAETMVNPNVQDTDSLEFDVKLTDSVFLGQPMMPPEFDIGSINLDLAVEPMTTAPVSEPLLPVAEPADVEAETEVEPPVDLAHWEEVNTKLDLAKAYEEMGDLEGARELLQEVVGEGPSDLVEQAQAILGRIGE